MAAYRRCETFVKVRDRAVVLNDFVGAFECLVELLPVGIRRSLSVFEFLETFQCRCALVPAPLTGAFKTNRKRGVHVNQEKSPGLMQNIDLRRVANRVDDVISVPHFFCCKDRENPRAPCFSHGARGSDQDFTGGFPAVAADFFADKIGEG